MTRQHQFRYSHAPRVAEFGATAVTMALAALMTAVAIDGAIDPSQRAGNALDDYGVWFFAAATWTLPAIFGLGVLRRIRAFKEGPPAIAVDDNGITLPGLTGKPHDLKWSEVTGLELEHNRGKCALWVRAGSVSGSVSLDGLDVRPLDVWDVVRQCRERAK